MTQCYQRVTQVQKRSKGLLHNVKKGANMWVRWPLKNVDTSFPGCWCNFAFYVISLISILWSAMCNNCFLYSKSTFTCWFWQQIQEGERKGRGTGGRGGRRWPSLRGPQPPGASSLRTRGAGSGCTPSRSRRSTSRWCLPWHIKHT